MAIFLTGATGYLGAHVAANLLEQHNERLNLLVRARNANEAAARLWRAMQLHLDLARFQEHLASRITVFTGDLTGEHFSLDPAVYADLARSTDSVIHCAASLNRKSEKTCLNVNLRGTLEVIELARRANEHHGLRRFSHVSTVAVGSGSCRYISRGPRPKDSAISSSTRRSSSTAGSLRLRDSSI